MRPKPDATVLDWFANTPDEALFFSVLTLREIRKGVEKLADTQRREKLRIWLEHDLRDWFGPRILPIGPDVADNWDQLLAQAGRPVPATCTACWPPRRCTMTCGWGSMTSIKLIPSEFKP